MHLAAADLMWADQRLCIEACDMLQGSPYMPPLPHGPGWGHSMSAEGVDLHVDYATEIAPHLGRRLVSKLVPNFFG
jgi:hypothetical protein